MKEQERHALLTAAIKRTDKRLELFKEHNSGITEKDIMREFAQNEGIYWEDLEPIINAAKDQLDQYREGLGSDRQAALDAFPDGMNYQGLYVWDWFTKNSETIRAALTAPDVNAEKYDALFGTIESQKQTHDALIRMNRELLEALMLFLKVYKLENGITEGTIPPVDIIAVAEKAIARAEAQKVGK